MNNIYDTIDYICLAMNEITKRETILEKINIILKSKYKLIYKNSDDIIVDYSEIEQYEKLDEIKYIKEVLSSKEMLEDIENLLKNNKFLLRKYVFYGWNGKLDFKFFLEKIKLKDMKSNHYKVDYDKWKNEVLQYNFRKLFYVFKKISKRKYDNIFDMEDVTDNILETNICRFNDFVDNFHNDSNLDIYNEVYYWKLFKIDTYVDIILAFDKNNNSIDGLKHIWCFYKKSTDNLICLEDSIVKKFIEEYNSTSYKVVDAHFAELKNEYYRNVDLTRDYFNDMEELGAFCDD